MAVKLLDCTLRDGGYVNDWNFGYQNIRRIINDLCKANVDYVEMGFLDDRATSTIERSLIANMEIANQILEVIDKRNTKIMAMINFGTFPIDKILNKNESLIDGIRVMLKKEKMIETLEFCKQLKEKGYIVSANAVAINRYSEEELIELANKVNISKIDILTFADTYGICREKDVEKLFSVVNKYLDKDIAMGFHSHNSLQLAFSNTIHFVNQSKNRNIIIDGSLYGMGKGAGNACTELLINTLNNNYNKNYNSYYVEKLIENIVLEEYEKRRWGYEITYYIAADSWAHPDYIEYFHNKLISYNEIRKIVKYLPEEYRFTYNIHSAKDAYDKYKQRKKCIIFDIDGTLFNTSDGIMKSMDYAAETLGYAKLTKSKKSSIIGPSIFLSFKEVYNETDENAKKLVKSFRDYYEKKQLLNYNIYDGVENMLNDLKKEGYILSVATNKREDLAIKLVEDAKLSKYFTFVKGTDQYGSITKKDLILSIKENLNIDNSDVIMIGDTLSDYNSAIDSQVLFIGVTYGYGFKKNSKLNLNIDLVNTVEELSKKIQRRDYES